MRTALPSFFVAAACALALLPAHAMAIGGSDAAVTSSTQSTNARDRVEALQEDLKTASDLRLRIAYSTRNLIEIAPSAEGGYRVSTEFLIPAATLYEQARGSTDPVLLDLLLARCSFGTTPASGCDRLDLARRWTAADTQNQVAWLALATVQHDRGDEAGARATFERAALASQWHEHERDIARVITDAAPRDLSANERFAWLSMALGRAFAVTTRVQPLLAAYCKEADATRAACLRIVATSVRDADSIATLMMASILAARAQAPASVVDEYRQKSNATYWALLTEAKGLPDAFTDLNEADAQAAVTRMQRVLARGDRVRGEDYLIEQHVGEAEGARRFMASLSNQARDTRERMLQDARAAGRLNAGSTHSTTASP